MIRQWNTTWVRCAGTCFGLALIAWAYWPGLSGPFLFDDFANLDVLGAYGRIDDWSSFAYYITSGIADPTGRPIALLTFLLDGTTWPAAPWPFKRTNLVLHLLNTGLLALVIARLQQALQRNRPALPLSPWTPVVAALLWGAHPFLVSTTLYVVQREAMLPMSFVLLAVLAWQRAVACFDQHRPRAGWGWAVLGFGAATLLAGLSKANGFLAPLLVGLTYLWLLRPASVLPTARTSSLPAAISRPPARDRAALLCLGLPSVLVLLYLVHLGWGLWSVPQIHNRDWTLPERLLSQPRALWDYVARLVLPRAGAGGLYVDDFVASRGWWQPATTLPAMLALMASIVAAIAARRRFPIASFAWLFFLAAHLLESSTIPLELYFEHRNYLPAAFLGWPLAHALLRPGSYAKVRALLSAVILAGLLLLTWQRALVWGDEALLTAVTAEHQEDSERSQLMAADAELERGDVRAALARIHALQRQAPDSIPVAINAIGLECQGTQAVSADTMTGARRALRIANGWNYNLYEWMQGAARDPTLQACRGFGLPGLGTLVDAAEANPYSDPPRRKRDLWHVRGRIALAQQRPALALRWFDAALAAEPDPEYALVQAAALGDAGAQALGVRHLDHYARIETSGAIAGIHDMPSLHAWLLRRGGYYRNELSSLRQRLQADQGPRAYTTSPR